MCTAYWMENLKVTNYLCDSVVIGRIILKSMSGNRLLKCKIYKFRSEHRAVVKTLTNNYKFLSLNKYCPFEYEYALYLTSVKSRH